MIEVFNSGGGTQSTAIAALIVQDRLPKPDFVVIADTGRERQSTWDYLEQITKPMLRKIGIDVHVISKAKYGYNHGDLWSKNGNTLLMPTFTDFSGEIGKMDGFCSKTWKVEPVENYLRDECGVKKKDIRKWIGFSVDEARRAMRMMGTKDYVAGKIRFPLIDDVPMRRHQSLAVVQEMGWPQPPRSMCWMCPNQTNDEWKHLKETSPMEFQKACELEQEIREKDPTVFLHNSGVLLGDVDFEAQPYLPGMDHACSSGVCFV